MSTLDLLGFALAALAVVWLLAVYGHRFYVELVAAETEKHAQEARDH